jgi:hypothetical protein
MFNLEIPKEKFQEIDKLLNKDNLRARKSNENETTVTLTYRTQERFEKAQAIVNSVQ